MQKGLYTIERQSGANIDIAFTTWVFKTFAQSKNLSVDQLIDYIQGKGKNGQSGGLYFSIEDLLSLMLIGAKYSCVKRGENFSYTDIDACEWLDELGGINGGKVKEMMIVIVATLFDHDPTDIAKLVSVEEKKSIPAGRTSTRSRQKQE